MEEFIIAANSGLYEELMSDSIETDLETGSFTVSGTDKERKKTLQLLRKQYDQSLRKTGLLIGLRRHWLRYAAAILLIAGVSAYIWSRKPTEEAGKIASTRNTDVAAPGSNLAVITLGDGTVISLDTISSGQLASQGNVRIKKLNDGKIVYEGLNEGEIIYNTISVPRGSKTTSITLSDGSRVYLNAATELTYPVSFSPTERRVEIKGEGYFEITKDAKRQFIVSDGNTITEVLGTTFNINAYPDELFAATTLLEGAVKVSTENTSLLLKPGEQSKTDKQGELSLATGVNTEEVIAWKNGYFQFKEADLLTIARQISRWYNVDFIFENKKAESEVFRGKFSRTSSLAELLKVLEFSDVKFTIDGSKVIIK